MATLLGFGTLLDCPYNKSHRVQATAMARHLFKCRKMYPDVVFVTCPFNHAHKIAEPELKMHTATCDDRANFDMYKYCITTAAATHTSTEAQEPELIYNQEDPVAPSRVRDEDEECWDDLRIPAYNPQEYCAKAKIIRKATLKTPAEKRAFYEQEAQRHKELDVKIKQERKEKGDDSSSDGDMPRRPMSPPRKTVRRHSPSPKYRGAKKRSRSPTSSKYRSKLSPSPVRSSRKSRSPVLPVRSRRSRSNSRKSRSLSRTRDRVRKRQRSRSAERGGRRYRRSPSPNFRGERLAYDRTERDRYPRLYDQYDTLGPRYETFDRSYGGGARAGGSGRHPEPYANRGFRYERDRRETRRDSRDRDDEEHIYRRDFRD